MATLAERRTASIKGRPWLVVLLSMVAMLAVAVGAPVAVSALPAVLAFVLLSAAAAANVALLVLVTWPALSAWTVQRLAAGGDEGPRPSGLAEWYPHGNAATRAAWTRRHVWRASFWCTLASLVIVGPLSLLLPSPARAAVLVAWVVITPFAFRVGIARDLRRAEPAVGSMTDR